VIISRLLYFGVLGLCHLELVLGGLGTPLGIAFYKRVGYLSVRVQNEPTSDTSNICGSGSEPLLACHCASVCTL